MRKVYCLYRVSTEQQVEKHDIPMQREACYAFAQEKGWSIEKEYYERGVSGFKVSAEKRDAIQQIKCAAWGPVAHSRFGTFSRYHAGYSAKNDKPKISTYFCKI